MIDQALAQTASPDKTSCGGNNKVRDVLDTTAQALFKQVTGEHLRWNTVTLYSHCTYHRSRLSIETFFHTILGGPRLLSSLTASSFSKRRLLLLFMSAEAAPARCSDISPLSFLVYFWWNQLLSSDKSQIKTRVLHHTCTFRHIPPPKWISEVAPAPERAVRFIKEICTSPAWHPTLAAPTDPAMLRLYNQELSMGMKTCAAAGDYSSVCAKRQNLISDFTQSERWEGLCSPNGTYVTYNSTFAEWLLLVLSTLIQIGILPHLQGCTCIPTGLNTKRVSSSTDVDCGKLWSESAVLLWDSKVF